MDIKEDDSVNFFGGINNRDQWTIVCEQGGADFRIFCTTDIPKFERTTTEFCNPCGGRGRSAKTCEALRELMLEIQKDVRAQDPKAGYPWPAEMPIPIQNGLVARRLSDEPPGYMEVSLLERNSCTVACLQGQGIGRGKLCALKFHQLPSGIWEAMKGLEAAMRKDNKIWPL